MGSELNLLRKVLTFFQITFSWLIFISVFAVMFEPIRAPAESLLIKIGTLGILIVVGYFVVAWISVWNVIGYFSKKL